MQEYYTTALVALHMILHISLIFHFIHNLQIHTFSFREGKLLIKRNDQKNRGGLPCPFRGKD